MANTKSLRVESTGALTGGKGMSAPDSPDWDILSGNERTFEFWIKPNSFLGNAGLIERWSNTSKNLLVRLESDGTVTAYPGTGSTTISAGLTTSTTVLSSGTWYHAAVTWNGSTLKVYIGGELEDTGGSVTPGASTSVLGLAGAPVDAGSGSNYDGWMAHIRVWDVERTAAQISDNMNVSLVGDETNLLHNWKLDDDYTNSVSGEVALTPINSPTFEVDVPFVEAVTNQVASVAGISNV